MTKLLEIKDQLIRFYSKYETYLYPIVKFAVALALFYRDQYQYRIHGENQPVSGGVTAGACLCHSADWCHIMDWRNCGACGYVCAFHGSSTYRTDFVCDSVLCIFSFRTERRTDGCAYTAV